MSSEINSIPYSKSGDKDQDEKLLQPFTYILQVPGKQIRAKLAHAMNCWLKIPAEKLQAVGDIVQILHNSSLLLDDIQDNSILRRGIPVAHSIFGVPSTINAANYAIFIALERVLALDHPEYSDNKSFCEDLSEGKFSFPIIHAIQTYPEDRQVLNILRKRTTDIEVKKYCVTLLEKFGSFAYTRTVLEDLDKKARDEVERLGGNPLFIEFLDKLSCWPKNPMSLDVEMNDLSASD
ncbi:hypothetical protein G9C98_002077 [Cotesia typhae]|uniref:Geranylgeranyl pyrophosphate synthase n=1 Tax=Cotesia typhae TaxID=2053667 RepID=A0A8J5VCQ6_9HYME|nr:hypothetical protein G9C98_002077 [Cotesia typhae]